MHENDNLREGKFSHFSVQMLFYATVCERKKQEALILRPNCKRILQQFLFQTFITER